MILEAKNLMYSYKSKRDTMVLKSVSASFEEGTFYAIIGSSGSGKTTFLSLLAGLDSPGIREGGVCRGRHSEKGTK